MIQPSPIILIEDRPKTVPYELKRARQFWDQSKILFACGMRENASYAYAEARRLFDRAEVMMRARLGAE